MIFLQSGDSNKFKNLWEDLENALLIDEDKYPTTITAAYELMSKYKCSNIDNNNTTKTDDGKCSVDTSNTVQQAPQHPYSRYKWTILPCYRMLQLPKYGAHRKILSIFSK